MSFLIPLPSVPNGSFPSPFLSQVLFTLHIPSEVPLTILIRSQSHTGISLHLFSIDSMKQMINKSTTNPVSNTVFRLIEVPGLY